MEPGVDPSMTSVDASVPGNAMAPDVVRQHAFAQWPMPDSTPGSQVAPSYTASANTVLDNVTHLVWQRTLPSAYEGCTGKVQETDTPGTLCFWEEAKRYCASSAVESWLGGLGWRLPTLIELASLIDVNQPMKPPMIDTAAFPQAPTDGYFSSSTPLMNPLPTIGAVNYYYGFVQHLATGPTERAAFVRCVRATDPPDVSEDRYEIQASVVHDRMTKLNWARDAAPGVYDWMHAVEYCKNLGQGWRLPAQKELLTLIDPTVPSPLIDPIAFPRLDDEFMTFWTITADLQTSLAWTVRFSQGWSTASNGSGEHHVRCVR
jgi:hypothetical protein